MAMYVLTDCPFFAPPDGVNTMPADADNVLTNRWGLLELHRVSDLIED